MQCPKSFENAVTEFLRRCGHASLRDVIQFAAPEFDSLPGPERVQIWGTLRAFLRTLEEKGVVRCSYTSTGNLWRIHEPDQGGSAVEDDDAAAAS